MVIVLCYDISTDTDGGQKRLRQVASACERYGTRVQNSVFEIDITPGDFEILKQQLTHIIDEESDSIRIYRIGKDAKRKTTIIGLKNKLELGSPMLF